MKGKSIIEVILVFALFALITFVYKPTKIAELEFTRLGGSYIIGCFWFVIPICILLAAKRNFKSYGLTFSEWRKNLDIGMTCFLIFAIIDAPIRIYSMIQNVSTESSLLGIFSSIVILVLILLVLRRRDKSYDPTNPPNPVPNVLILIFLLLLPLFLGVYMNTLNRMVVLTLVRLFIIPGFGEEVFFRGYIQSRVNEEFGRPFSFLGVNFGVGLIVSSFLFGFIHVLIPFSPLAGQFELKWWGFSSFFFGLIVGFVREKTGSILPCGIVHGLYDAVGITLAVVFFAPLLGST